MDEQLREYPYRVVISESLRVLQREITIAAVKGYRPVGNVTITQEDGKTMFHQAIWSEQALKAYVEKYVFPQTPPAFAKMQAGDIIPAQVTTTAANGDQETFQRSIKVVNTEPSLNENL